MIFLSRVTNQEPFLLEEDAIFVDEPFLSIAQRSFEVHEEIDIETTFLVRQV